MHKNCAFPPFRHFMYPFISLSHNNNTYFNNTIAMNCEGGIIKYTIKDLKLF